MKRIIDGVLYDTEAENVELIASKQYSNPGDFEHWRKELYYSKGGNWFLYEEGGPMSYMGEYIGNGSKAGSKDITPITATEARDLLEDWNEPELLEQFFPEYIKKLK
jgi:hypothetical protein